MNALIATSTLLTPVDQRPLRTFIENGEFNVAGIDFCRALGYRQHDKTLVRLGPDCVVKRTVCELAKRQSTYGAKFAAAA